MKVAFFIGTLNQGGMESLTMDICNRHREADFEIVCIYRHEGNCSDKFHNTGVQLFKINYTNILSYFWRLRKTILREKISIVHAQTQSNALVCVLALVGTNVPVITTLHGFSFAQTKWIYRRIVYGFCKSILCVSEFQKKYYVDKWNLPQKNKLQVVSNGIDFSKFDNEYSEPDFLLMQEKKADFSTPIKLAMVGSFMSGRSQISLLRSIRLLCEQTDINFVFYFVGKRVDSEPWRYEECVRYTDQNNLQEIVHFVGGRSDVPAILQHIDGFIYSSEHDTFGIAVVEAMGVGVPVIANDWDVMKEITQNGRWGKLYKTGDERDCAQAVLELMQHIEQRKRDAKQKAEEVRKAYSIEKHIENLSKVYEQVLQ